MRKALHLALCVVLFCSLGPIGGGDWRRRDVRDGALAESDAAYRLRLVELTLATGSAPRRDAFVSVDDALVPWPPLAHATLARALRVDLGERATAASEGDVDDELLAERTGLYGQVLAALTALLVALGARRLAGGVAGADTRDVGLAGLAAVLVYVLVPLSDVSIGGSALFAAPWIQLSVAAQVLFALAALQAREHFGRLLPAALAGAAAGLGFVADFTVAPVALVVGALLARDAWLRGSGDDAGLDEPAGLDPWHPTILWAMFALTPVAFTPGPLPWHQAWPRPTMLLGAALAAFGAFGVAHELRRSFRSGDDPWGRPRGGFVLALTLAVGLPLAGADPRYRHALVPLLAVATGFAIAASVRVAFLADASGASERKESRFALLGLGLLLPFAAWAPRWMERGERAAEGGVVAAAAGVRHAVPSLGAWNHPAAEPEERVLVHPHAAAHVALRGRRPVVALQLPGFPRDARARSVAELLAEGDAAAFVDEARALGATWFLATPFDAEDVPARRGLPVVYRLGREAVPGFDPVGAEGSGLFRLTTPREPPRASAPSD